MVKTSQYPGRLVDGKNSRLNCRPSGVWLLTVNMPFKVIDSTFSPASGRSSTVIHCSISLPKRRVRLACVLFGIVLNNGQTMLRVASKELSFLTAYRSTTEIFFPLISIWSSCGKLPFTCQVIDRPLLICHLVESWEIASGGNPAWIKKI